MTIADVQINQLKQIDVAKVRVGFGKILGDNKTIIARNRRTHESNKYGSNELLGQLQN